jgi:hypothetical protein
VVWDFILDGDLDTILVYSYYRNVQKRNRDIGWGLTTLYDLRSTGEQEEVVEQTVKDLTGKGH